MGDDRLQNRSINLSERLVDYGDRSVDLCQLVQIFVEEFFIHAVYLT